MAKKIKRVISVSLAIILIFFCAVWSCYAENKESTSVQQKTRNKDMYLSDMASEYVDRYIRAVYLYEEIDLRKNTVLQLAAPPDNNIQMFINAADYLRITRSEQNIARYNFKQEIEVLELTKEKNTAKVHLSTSISFQYSPEEETTYCGDNYDIIFIELNDTWLVSYIYTEELDAFGLMDGFDYEKELSLYHQQQCERALTCAEEPYLSTIPKEVPQVASSYIIHDTTEYNKNNAIAYAYTYTYGSMSSGNNSAYVNPRFPHFIGANCQNFISQCVWAGLGGSDTSSAVQNGLFPMDIPGSGEDHTWYCRSYSDRSSSWGSCTNFYYYLLNSSQDQYERRMYGETYTVVNGNFSATSLTTNKLKAAVLHLPNADNTDMHSHAIMLTTVNSLSPYQMRFCANSPMRRNQALMEYYNVTTKTITVLVPMYMRINTVCTAPSHSYANYSQGTSCYCVNCGAVKLKAVGNMLKPVAVNSTHTVSGSANVTCYRLAIGITDPDGNSSWHEYYNTQTASWNFTFTKKGVYSVIFAARDIPETEPHSCGASHVFKIRVE